MDQMNFPQLIHYWVVHFLPMLQAGIEWTVPLTLISFALGLILAMLTALARLSGFAPLVLIARFYVWVIRGTPLLVQLFIIFYGLPGIGIVLPAFPSAVIGFTLSVGAYNSEVIRAAILSIPKGQWEAGYSLGMTSAQVFRRIILPQAARVAVPPLANAFISLVKDTSLAAVITVRELLQVAEEINATEYKPLATYIEAAFIYLLFSTVLSYLQGWVEKRLDKHVAH
jgi:L-cystine transport system permease protein